MAADPKCPGETRIPAPPQVFDVESLTRGVRCIAATHAGQLAVLYYEPASLTAALFHRASALWTLLGPLTFGELVKSLPAREIQLDPSRLADWIEACTAHSGEALH